MNSPFTNIVRQYTYGRLTSNWKAFGIPLVARLCNITTSTDLSNLYLRLLNPFLLSTDDGLGGSDTSEKTVEAAGNEGVMTSSVGPSGNDSDSSSDEELEFYHTDEKWLAKGSKILMDEPFQMKEQLKQLNVLVCWSDKQIQQYDTRGFSLLPEVFKPGLLAKRPQESVSLYKCLEAFLQEEPLGPEDMWLVNLKP